MHTKCLLRFSVYLCVFFCSFKLTISCEEKLVCNFFVCFRFSPQICGNTNEFMLRWQIKFVFNITEEVLQGVSAGIDLFDSEYVAQSASYH